MTLLVSVVVPTYRRPQLLDRCLQALFAQNFHPGSFEIIVVDDGPADGATREKVAAWQQHMHGIWDFNDQKTNGGGTKKNGKSSLPIGRLTNPQLIPVSSGARTEMVALDERVRTRVIQAPRIFYLPAYHTQGPAAARNLGWRFASGQIIAFTDDDCIPDPDWLAHGVAAFQDNTAAVSGRVMVPLPSEPTDNDLNTTGLERSNFVTANCFYRRGVLEEVGGFDERFGMAWREDSDLYFTLHKRGCALSRAEDAIVVHPVRQEAWGESLRQQRKSFYNALLFKKHPDLYRQHIQAAPPWHYYAILGAVLVALLGVVFSAPWVVGLGGLAWLLLVLRFAAMRLKNTSRKPEHVAEMVLTSAVIPFLSIYWRLRGAIHWKVFFL